MKWGVRRDGSGGRFSRRSKPEPPPVKKSQDTREAEKLRKKSAQELSNAELKRLNERLNLEQNYSRLTQEKSTISKGASHVKTALDVVRTINDVYNAYNSPMVKTVRKLLTD